MLDTEEINIRLLENCRIFHFGSVSMTAEPSRSATLKAVEMAKQSGAMICFDPNFRAPLWENENLGREAILSMLSLVDLLKVSDEELGLLTGQTDIGAGAEILSNMGPSAVIVTLGADGAFYYTKKSEGFVPALDVKAVDTTGAGDAFVGGLLSRLLAMPKLCLPDIANSQWEDAVRFGNAAGGLTTKNRGAIPALPTKEEIEFYFHN